MGWLVAALGAVTESPAAALCRALPAVESLPGWAHWVSVRQFLHTEDGNGM